jgi:hypothetical protein
VLTNSGHFCDFCRKTIYGHMFARLFAVLCDGIAKSRKSIYGLARCVLCEKRESMRENGPKMDQKCVENGP